MGTIVCDVPTSTRVARTGNVLLAGARENHGPSIVKERPIICVVGPTQRKDAGRHSARAQADDTHTGNPSESTSPRRTSASRTPPPPPEPWDGAASASAAAARHPVLNGGMPRGGAAVRRRRQARDGGEDVALRRLWEVRR